MSLEKYHLKTEKSVKKIKPGDEMKGGLGGRVVSGADVSAMPFSLQTWRTCPW